MPATAATAFLLTACGGGGGGGGDGGGGGGGHAGSISTRTVTATLNGSGGTVSPLGAQTVTRGDDLVFTITPDPHKVAKASSNCGFINDFSDSGTTFTVKRVNTDCTVTFSFETIVHDVTARVVNGMLVPMSPAETAGKADMIALDIANQAVYAANGNGGSGTLQVYAIGANGTLTASASPLSAPLAANCDSSSDNTAPGQCLLVGKTNNAADHVYAILEQAGGPLIRVYQGSSGGLTKVADVNPAANVVDGDGNPISITAVHAIALDGAHDRLFAAVNTKDVSDQEGSAILSYTISANGTFAFNQGVPLSDATRQLKGLVADATGEHLYVSYDEPSQSPTVLDKAGVFHFTVEASTGNINGAWSASFLSQNSIKTQDFALVPGAQKAYLVYSYNNFPFGNPVNVRGYAIDGNGDFASLSNPTILTYEDTQRVSLDIADNGEVAYLKAKRNSDSAAPSGIAIYSINPGTARLSDRATAATFASNSPHSMAIDYDNGLAYVAAPADDKIAQYQVGTDQGSISPASQTVDDGGTISVTLTAANSSDLGAASGCDNGALSANTYSASNITADCEVIATFVKP